MNGAFYYVAYGQGGAGDGERLHSHTVAQTFTCILGKIRVTVADHSTDLEPGQSEYAPPGVTHGVLCLTPGSEYISLFFERDRDTIDIERILREQVPGLTPEEIKVRAQELLNG
jgi:glyoxylate utilization-related uncharacterized protein